MSSTEIKSIAATIKVYDNQQVVFSAQMPRQLVIGRQDRDDEQPYRIVEKDGTKHLIAARFDENNVSRLHVQITMRSWNSAYIVNRSKVCPVEFESCDSLACGQGRDVALPVLFFLGDRAIRVEPEIEEDLPLTSLAHQTMAPGEALDPDSTIISLVRVGEEIADTPRTLDWLRATANVFQSVASSPSFLDEAVRVACELIGLDFSAVLLLQDHHWDVAAEHRTDGAPIQWRPSLTMLHRLCDERRTIRHDPSMLPLGTQTPESMKDVKAVLAAPILNPQAEVIGTLYGGRCSGPEADSNLEIREWEAAYFELLAGAVAAGLARIHEEQAALAARIRFEQFFTPELTRELETNPDLLRGREADVSILFCDIRGFSRITHAIGPQRTMQWINDVMDALSECVALHEGVLVDYVGDELVAMWGAPNESSDHPERACRAALAMIERLSDIDSHWQSELGEPTQVGIGINSGTAFVGNTGSHRKFKYGPLGTTVNLASRVQSATKHLKAQCLVTGNTVSQLSGDLVTRPLCEVQVVDIDQPLPLYEVVDAPSLEWQEMAKNYEIALEAFNEGDFQEASRLLGNILSKCPDDGPSLCLLARAVNAMAMAPEPLHPVWVLPSK